MNLISIQSHSLTLSPFWIVATSDGLLLLLQFYSKIIYLHFVISSSWHWRRRRRWQQRLLNQYYLFAMLPIQLNLALIELPFEWLLLRLVSCSFARGCDELKTTSIDMYQWERRENENGHSKCEYVRIYRIKRKDMKISESIWFYSIFITFFFRYLLL